MDQHPGVAFVAHYGVGHVREKIDPLVGHARIQRRQQAVGRRVLAGDRHPDTAHFVRVNPVAADQQRSVAAPQRAAAVQHPVTVEQLRHDRITQFRNVRNALQRSGVQLFDIGQRKVEFETLGVDTAVHHRIEHERIVRTGRYMKL